MKTVERIPRLTISFNGAAAKTWAAGPAIGAVALALLLSRRDPSLLQGGMMRPPMHFLVLGLLAIPTQPAAAQSPTMATLVQGLPISFDDCKGRVSRALSAEGFGGLRDFGNGWLAWSGSLAASIGCIHGNNETVVVITATGPGESAARDRLAALVRGDAVTSPTPAGVIGKAPGSGFCLNLHNNANGDGAVVNLWACNGHVSQQWRVGADGTIRHGAFPDKCLNLHNHEDRDGAVVNLWTCNGHASQQWRVSPDMTIRQAGYPSKCLNLHFNALTDGAVINLWSCNGADSQRWSVSR